MKKRVYLVSTGCYSDYSVVGLFSTRGRAMTFRKTFPNAKLNDIQGFVLDEFDSVIEACKGRKVFEVEMNLVDGDVKKVREKTGELWTAQMALRNKLVMNGGLIWTHVFADSKEHAVKIVAELRRQVVVQMNTDEGQ